VERKKLRVRDDLHLFGAEFRELQPRSDTSVQQG
jgi:hypothetical protein